MKRLWICFFCCVASSLFAKDPEKIEWTPAEIQQWFKEYAKTEPDGERGIEYNGTDETHHRFSVRVRPGGKLVIRDIRKAELKVPEELPFHAVESERSSYYFLDPSRGFIQVPNPIAPPEARSLEERLAALEAYVNPTPSSEPANELEPKLLKRAEEELKLRLPGAKKIQSRLSFEKPDPRRTWSFIRCPTDARAGRSGFTSTTAAGNGTCFGSHQRMFQPSLHLKRVRADKADMASSRGNNDVGLSDVVMLTFRFERHEERRRDR
ncbi:MAG: hypothetical protein QM760_01525 [Nibricoccus sp.]